VVKKGRLSLRNEGIGLVYEDADIVGTFQVQRVDEEVSSGQLTRSGFFDRMEPGDEVVQKTEAPPKSAPAVVPVNPELQTLLRTLR
jgi:hypothetical protein